MTTKPAYTSDANALLAAYKNQLPVPVVQIAKQLGIRVHLTDDFDDRKSGQIQLIDDSYHIYLNAKHPYKRNRFTLAHEIGHYLLHRDYLEDAKGLADYDGRTIALARSGSSSDTSDIRELEANNFAADLLMPVEKFSKVWAANEFVDEVAKIFDVSPEAATVRATNLSKAVNDGRTTDK